MTRQLLSALRAWRGAEASGRSRDREVEGGLLGGMGDSAYSFSLTTFSPSGKLVQIEYALNAVAKAVTALGVKAKNGVVIATEKKLPSVLIDEKSVQKILMLTENIAIVYAGMGPDFRVLVRKGRKAAQQYFRVYREVIPVGVLVRELAAVMQEFTQQGGVRPFGISLLLAGFDHNGPQLYQASSPPAPLSAAARPLSPPGCCCRRRRRRRRRRIAKVCRVVLWRWCSGEWQASASASAAAHSPPPCAARAALATRRSTRRARTLRGKPPLSASRWSTRRPSSRSGRATSPSHRPSAVLRALLPHALDIFFSREGSRIGCGGCS